ncbi:hypothetical protein [Nonlabens tegetincola]|uniref:hypothetical protein n=1 Tax=Nonlabens tegetincola TaxID=323273 RepID=UPI0030C7A280
MKLKSLLLSLFVVLSMVSCSIEDDGPQIAYSAAKVVEVNMPDTLDFGTTHIVTLKIEKPAECFVFSGFEVIPTLNERTVTPVLVYNANDCFAENNPNNVIEEEVNLNFIAASNGSYVFKFFNGLDADGLPTYIEMTVPVRE